MLARSTAAVFLLGLAATAEQPPAGTLYGVITQVQGAVEAVGPGTSGLPLASPWQVIQAGVTVRVPENGNAGVVCSNRRFVRLRGPASWSLTKSACSAGKELKPAEYALIAPQGGRFKVVEGLLVLEREIRSGDDDDPFAPVVLSPRNTVLRSPRPAASWSRVSKATAYQVQWIGRGATSAYEVRLRADDVACSQDLERIPICFLPWPEDRPDLPPGRIFSLKIAAQSGIEENWRFNDPVEVRTQEITQATELERQLRDLENLGLEGPALMAARAGLFAERGLYADAADLYRRSLAAAPTPALRITLADLYFTMGLHFLAEPRYREALSDGAPSVRAAAAFGLGRLSYSRGKHQDSAAFFRQARELYAQLGLGEEESAARQAAEKASQFAPTYPSRSDKDYVP